MATLHMTSRYLANAKNAAVLCVAVALLATSAPNVLGAGVTYDPEKNGKLTGSAHVNKIGSLLLADGLAIMSGTEIAIVNGNQGGTQGAEQLHGQLAKTSTTGGNAKGYAIFDRGNGLSSLSTKQSEQRVNLSNGTSVKGTITKVDGDAVTIAGQVIALSQIKSISGPNVFKFDVPLTGDSPTIIFKSTSRGFTIVPHSKAGWLGLGALTATAIAVPIAVPLAVDSGGGNGGGSTLLMGQLTQTQPGHVNVSLPWVRPGRGTSTRPNNLTNLSAVSDAIRPLNGQVGMTNGAHGGFGQHLQAHHRGGFHHRFMNGHRLAEFGRAGGRLAFIASIEGAKAVATQQLKQAPGLPSSGLRHAGHHAGFGRPDHMHVRFRRFRLGR